MKLKTQSVGAIILNLMLKTATSKAVVVPQQMNGNTRPQTPVANQLNVANVTPAISQAPANQVAQPTNIQGANVIEQPISLQGTVIPKKVTWTVSSVVTNMLASTIYLFNNNALFPVSANTVQPVVTCTDGFVGKLIERLLVQAGDKGIQCYGFNVTCTDGVTGLPDTASLNAMNATLLNYTGTGANAVPTSFDVSGTERKTDYKDGIMTIISPFVLYSLAQFQYQQPAQKVFQFTFYFTPIVN